MTERITVLNPRPRRPVESGLTQPIPPGAKAYRFRQANGQRLIVYANSVRTAWHRLHQAWMLGQVDMASMVHEGLGEPDDGHEWRRIS